MLIFDSTINVSGQSVPQIIPVVQGDTGRSILFTLADFTIPQGSTATYYVQKPSGEAVYNAATIDGNTVLVELTAQSIIEAGDNYGQVRIENDGEVVTSFDFILLVKPFRGIDATQSTTEMNIFDKAVEQAEEAIDEAKVEALEEIAEAGSGNIAEAFDAANSYLAGEYTIYQAKLYRFTSNHTGAWSGSDAEELTVGDALTDLEADTSSLKEDFDNLDETVNGITSVNYEANKNINTTTGELVDETGTCVSEFIPLTWTGLASYDCGDNTKYTYQISFYDANKAYIQSFRNPAQTGGVTYRAINVATQVTQGTAAYVRFSFKSGYVGKVFPNAQQNYWIAESSSSGGLVGEIGDLEELDTTQKSSIVNAINEVNGKVVSLPITPNDTNFFYVSPNLADPSAFVDNEYVNQTNGVFTSYNGHTRTDYVPVVAGQKYCIINPDDFNAGIRYAFYKSDKTYISGAAVNLTDIGNVVTAPNNAAFIVVSASTIRFPMMIAQSDEKISYVEYGIIHVKSEYIVANDTDNLVVNLPSKIYALAGYELNIYYENLVEDWTQYNFNVSCSKGMDMERGYKITPAESDVGTYPLTITISTKDFKSFKSVSTTLVVTSASAGSGTNPKIIVLGDSTTNSGYAVTHFKQNFADDVMDITLEGTRGTAPYLHEGRSGWTFQYYFSTAGSGSVLNPFYNPNTQTFDADYYFTQTGITKPDWFFINLGINDTFSYTSDTALESGIQTIKGYCDAMIASVKSAVPNVKIGLCITIPPNHSQDAFGKAYNCEQTRNRYKRNNVIWAHSLIDSYDNRETDSIYLIPIYTNLDTVWNMGMETLPVNARNTAITYESPISNGGVHPVESGYWQIADVYTAFIKAQA